ncbi:dapper homolog 2 isoform X1 [Molossus molossus]|uniref:Dishevelled binding antagonist of beta catenin 2 n=1 Tax=Molossus molossus TaxID=27622 RepID=A0A7J8GQ92_MOLMO|nr:dapper homolog 2 isoform X1 [Molossus molossus]KAF6461702.1 dishevelled binding antagonist of beta catenin 2 [Molossus molossus]
MWAPGGPPGPAGWDRRRVGARLLAAFAGLQELQGLRARQQARVRGALAMQPPPAPAAPRGPRAHELRLEAALAALQEQLSQLRCQDVGLKTHLDQLDQQISELQLGVRRTSTEGQDNDSRPSSGFYELSDGGSCSLSTSRTSMCSDHLSSSLGTLLPATPMARTGAGDCRPWSADETTMCGAPLSTWGLQATEDGAGQTLQSMSRPRPVSTGALERVLPAQLGLPTASPDTTSLLRHGPGLLPHPLDPKYQRDLVSRGGREVYLYPSPLHAVALQSPLFALTKETPPSDRTPPPRTESLPGPSGSIWRGPTPEAGPPRAYIDRLLGLRSQRNPPKGIMGEQGPPGCEVSPPQRMEAESHPEGLTCTTRRTHTGGGAQRRDPGGNSLEQWGPAPLMSPPHLSSLAEEGQKPSSSRACVGTILGSPWQVFGSQAQQATPDSWEGKARSPARTGPGPHDHPPSVTNGAAPVGLQMGQKVGRPATKAVKTRRETSDKALRSGRQPPPWGALIAPHLPPAWGAGLRRRPPQAREAPSRSCSESSLYPVPFLVPLLVARREGRGAPAQAWLPVEAAPAGEAGRRQRRWQSSVEISARGRLAGAQGPGLGPPRPATRRGGAPRPACPRARARLSCLGPQARSESGGSEHSAEGAPLFHSTIAETSEDEASDHTANRFGDRESSGSDKEGSVQGAGSHPAWPGAPAGSRPPLPPAPRLCRVKASRALKKRIRRFQPAALKVMTLV